MLVWLGWGLAAGEAKAAAKRMLKAARLAAEKCMMMDGWMDGWKRAMDLSGRVKLEVAGGDCRDGK